MGNDTRNSLIFEDIFYFISKIKGLGENLTIPRDATDIFSSEIINEGGKSHFVFNTKWNSLAKHAASTVVANGRAIYCRSA